MAKDFADISRLELAQDLNEAKRDAVSRMVKAWESKNAKRALQGAGLSTMAVTLAACGGSSTTPAPAAPTPPAVTPPAVTPVSFDLTAGTDSGAAFTGGTAADTYDGSRDIVGGNRFDTLDNADSLNGGGGIDTLSVALGGGVTVAPAALTSIEIIDVQTDANNSALNAVNADSLTTVKFSNGSANASVTNVQTLLSDIDITNNNGNNVTLTYANTAASGTADALDLDLSGVTGTPTISITAAGGAGGYEEITISALGSIDQTVTTLTIDAEVTTLKVDGASDLTITTAIAENVLTFNLSGADGDTSIATADADSVVTYTGGDGADTFDISVAGALATTDVLNGGAGTDILQVEDGDVIGLTAATAFTNITNFEHLFVDTALGGDIRVDRVSSAINDVTLNAGGAGTVSFAAGTTANVELNATTTGNLTIDDLGTGSADSLTIDMDLGAAATLGGTLIVTDYETVNLVIPDGTLTSGGAGITITPTTGGRSTLTITGDSSLTMAAADVITANVIDASRMVMNLVTDNGLVMAASTVSTSGATITGSNGVDTLYGSSSGDTISGGTGADIIWTQGGADILTTGAGDDTVNVTGNASSTSIVTVRITDFTAGASAGDTADDVIDLDASDLDGMLINADAGAAVITAFDLVDGNAATVGDDAAGNLQAATLNGVTTLAAGKNIIVLDGQNLATAAAVETALEVGGVFQIQTGTAFDDEAVNTTADGILVLYTDGTNAYLAAAYNESDIDSTDGFTAAALDVQNIIQFDGITDVGDFLGANFIISA